MTTMNIQGSNDDDTVAMGPLLCDDPSCSAIPGATHAPWCTGSDTLEAEREERERRAEDDFHGAPDEDDLEDW